MRTRFYRLDGHDTVACTLEEWARWFRGAERHVALNWVGRFSVSTVFLGVDHSFGVGPPLLFETMVFGPDGADKYQCRCTTWEEAEAQHAAAIAWARDERPIGQKTLNWARDAFETWIENLLDDPSVIADPRREIAELRTIAADLDIDLDALVRRLGTPVEQERWRKLEER